MNEPVSDRAGEPGDLAQGLPVAMPPNQSVAAWPRAPFAAEAPGPVQESQRIDSLDVLRGVAIQGILLVNIAFFVFPLMTVERLWLALRGLDRVMYIAVEMLCTFKFISLFSLLFGMGLALQSQRADAAGRPFAGLYSRRLAVLFVFGVLHGTLLWYGDILSAYALIGFIALAMRRAGDRTLLWAALVLFLMSGLIFALLTGLDSHGANPAPTWKAAMAGATEDESVDADIRSAIAGFARFMDQEVRIYREGPVSDQILHRSAAFMIVLFEMNLLLVGWRCLALFLLGMWLIRRGVLHHPERHARLLGFLMFAALPGGFAVQFAGLYLQHRANALGTMTYWYQAMLYVGSAGVSLGYFALIVRLCHSGRAAALLRRFAAVGRMALTNYIGHSIVCGLIFYSYGMGLFNHVSYTSAVLIAVAIFLAQLIISPVWLTYFRFGPLEWLWRSLTYWQLQPMRRELSGGGPA